MEPSTDPRLLEALREASKRKMTKSEAADQRVSFVYGSLKPESDVTREQIRQILADQEGGRVTRQRG